jgi:hypothetical protein
MRKMRQFWLQKVLWGTSWVFSPQNSTSGKIFSLSSRYLIFNSSYSIVVNPENSFGMRDMSSKSLKFTEMMGMLQRNVC